MIFIEHFNEEVTSNLHQGERLIPSLFKCASDHPRSGIVVYRKGIDIKEFLDTLEQYKEKGFVVSNSNHFNDDIGYIDDKPFININSSVVYPTWIKGTQIVYLHASLLLELEHKISKNQNFLYWINSIGKLTQPLGILNYQLPLFSKSERLTTSELYRFTAQHYKKRWTFLLLLNHFIYEKRVPLLSFLRSLFYKQIKLKIDVAALQSTSKRSNNKVLNYDVVIPTMGRKKYLYDVLKDLNAQQIVPDKVIIIEQNADKNSNSELNFKNNNIWKFEVIHHFTNITGACRARNQAVALSKAEWVLFFDDDVRVKPQFISGANEFINSTNTKSVTFSCLQKGEVERQKNYRQWDTFGSGCSMVHRSIVDQCSFDLALEHGYGEDADYGMQIRNLGYDVLYCPDNYMLHLKAPVGGFRNTFSFPWDEENIRPKPSPQIMYNRVQNTTDKQLKGYRLILLLKFYKQYSIKNPIQYLKYFNEAWRSSQVWAQRLAGNE